MQKFILSIFFIGLQIQAIAQFSKHDYKQFLTKLDGEYDNQNQVLQDTKTERMHISLHKISAKAIGNDVFYIKYYKDNDPKKLYRQRLLVFSFDKKKGIVKSEAMTFLADSVYLDINQKTDLQRSIKKIDLKSSLGCPDIWKLENGEYTGKSEGCPFFSVRRNKTILIYDKMRVTDQSLSTTEAGKEQDGTLLFGNLDTYALVLDRQIK